MRAQAQAIKASGVKHSGLGQAVKSLEAARASGAKHTGAGQMLRRKIRRFSQVHPDAKSVQYY